MALASLCARVQRLRPESLKFRAFVVDHGARAGSSGEAEAVRELVESKGKMIATQREQQGDWVRD